MDLSGSLIDHLNLPVDDLSASVDFHRAALAPLGIATVLEVRADPAADQKAMHAFGAQHKPFFWLVERGGPARAGYYGAFVSDPDGINVEAVHHTWVDLG